MTGLEFANCDGLAKRVAGYLYLAAVAAAFLAIAWPALANNTFPGTTIAGNGTLTASNTGATGETGEPTTYGGGALETMWYSWTAPATGVATFGLCNQTAVTTTNFDTTLQVFTGSAVNALTLVATNDDTANCNSTAGVGLGSWRQVSVTAGTIYRIQIDGYGNNDGNFNLHFGMVGLTVVYTGGIATEGGATTSFTVRLNSVPGANAAVTIGTSTQCTFAPTPLTFTIANWATPRTITVTATNDAVVEGPHSCSPASISASGGAYAGVSATPPTIIVYDNDVATFTIFKTVNIANIAAPGTLAYTITVTNTSGVNMTSPMLTDALTQGAGSRTLTSGPTLQSGDGGTAGRLDVFEVWVYAATYAVPQFDIDNGANLLNTATFDTAQTAPSSASATTTITQSPSLAIVKSANDTTDVTLGQVVTYTYVITNNGNITIDNVAVSDNHAGTGPNPAAANETLSGDVAPAGDLTDSVGNNGIWSVLRPGDSVTFTGAYTVNQADIDTL